MRIFATSAGVDLEGVVRDDADLDGQFPMLTDDGETLLVNGWLFIIDVIEPPEPPVWEHPDGFL